MYQLYNEDCLDGLKNLPDNSVDLITTDPPYCVGASSTGIKSSFADFNLMRPFFEQLFSEWRRVLKVGGHAYCCTDWRTFPFLYPLIIKSLTVRNLIVWVHGVMRPNNWYRGSYEFIIFATNGGSKREFGGGERDVWQTAKDSAIATVNRLHPSQKPVELMERMIQNSSRAGDVVLDPFAGSGTTAVACLNLGRKFIGYEIDEKYFNIALERIDRATAENRQSLFKFGDNYETIGINDDKLCDGGRAGA